MDTPAEAMTHLLAYGRKKLRAMSSRSYRIVSPSTNTSSAPLGSVVEFKIPGNQMAAFLDNNSMYFKFTIKNTTANNFTLEGKGAAYNFISKLEIMTSGQTIDTISNYNLLFSTLIDTDSTIAHRKNNGNILYGSKDARAGEVIAGGAELVVCLPFLLSSISNSRKYIPLFSRDSLQIRLTLADRVQAGISDPTQITANTSILVDQPELIYNVVELSADAFQAVSASVDNVFQIVSDSYRHTSANVTNATNQTLVANLGFSFSSLNRVIIVQRESALVNTQNSPSIGNRAQRGIVEARLLLNGASIPERPIKISTSCAEALAELLVADRSLVAFDSQNAINNAAASYKAVAPDGSDDANTGSFVLQIDTESMRSESDDPGIFSGAAAGSNIACNIDFFAQYTQLLTLDMNSSQVFIASV